MSKHEPFRRFVVCVQEEVAKLETCPKYRKCVRDCRVIADWPSAGRGGVRLCHSFVPNRIVDLPTSRADGIGSSPFLTLTGRLPFFPCIREETPKLPVARNRMCVACESHASRSLMTRSSRCPGSADQKTGTVQRRHSPRQRNPQSTLTAQGQSQPVRHVCRRSHRCHRRPGSRQEED